MAPVQKQWLVYNDEYPFDVVLNIVEAETAEQALEKAIKAFNRHVVVSEFNEEMQ